MSRASDLARILGTSTVIPTANLTLPSGSVLQTLSMTSDTNTAHQTLNTYTDTNMTLAITPSSTSNKILIISSFSVRNYHNSYNSWGRTSALTYLIKGKLIVSDNYAAQMDIGEFRDDSTNDETNMQSLTLMEIKG